MTLSKKFIIETSKEELTNNEKNSFMYGNKPNENVLLKSSIIKARECMTVLHWQDGEKIVEKELVKWVNEARTASELDENNYSFYGH